jgi:hypothetical protein
LAVAKMVSSIANVDGGPLRLFFWSLQRSDLSDKMHLDQEISSTHGLHLYYRILPPLLSDFSEKRNCDAIGPAQQRGNLWGAAECARAAECAIPSADRTTCTVAVNTLMGDNRVHADVSGRAD